MAKKKHLYQTDTARLPQVKIIVGEVPESDPGDNRRTLHSLCEMKSETEAKSLVTRLIGFLKNNEK